MRTPAPITSAILVLLASSLTMGGCLISSSKDSRISGAYVQPNTVSKVRLNHTSAQEVEELLGLPSNTTENDDGTETWNWNWSKHTDDDGAVFLVFGGSTEKTVHESVHIKFRDGVAIKKWRD